MSLNILYDDGKLNGLIRMVYVEKYNVNLRVFGSDKSLKD